MANIFENVTTINYQNQDIPLNGASVEDVLALLKVDSTATKEVRGTKLIISQAAGTKGAETPEELSARIASIVGEDNIVGADTTPRRIAQAESGKWVEVVPGFTVDEVDWLNEHGVTVSAESTEEELEAAFDRLSERDMEGLLDILNELGITATIEQAKTLKAELAK